MRFKFPKFYNPYTRITELTAWGQRVHERNKRLKEVNASQRAEIVGLRTRLDNMAALWRSAFNDATSAYDRNIATTAKVLGWHEQAIDGFMLEREELKADIAGLRGNLQEADAMIQSMAAEGLRMLHALTTERANREALEQDGDREKLEVIAYMKQCEAALLVAGVAIEDGETGPVVIMDTGAIMEGLRNGSTKTAPPQTIAA